MQGRRARARRPPRRPPEGAGRRAEEGLASPGGPDDRRRPFEAGGLRTDDPRDAPGSRAHSVVETPSAWMTADVEEVARRVVGLIDRPQRRLSVRRRLVWPFRALGLLARTFPALGDWVVTRIFHVDHARDSSIE